MSAERPLEVIVLTGELDLDRKEEIASALRVPPGASGILIDLARVTYADSTILAELLRFRSEAQALNIAVAVLVGTPQFTRLVQYAGLGDAFAIFETRGSALSYLAGTRTADR